MSAVATVVFCGVLAAPVFAFGTSARHQVVVRKLAKGSATASCPAGEHVVSGGLAAQLQLPIGSGSEVLPEGMRRTGSNKWTVFGMSATNLTGSRLTAVAYCETGPVPSVASKTVALPADKVGTVTATCPAGTVVVGGGYNSGASLHNVEFVGRLEALSSNQWLVTMINVMPHATTLTAIAYCVPGVAPNLVYNTVLLAGGKEGPRRQLPVRDHVRLRRRAREPVREREQVRGRVAVQLDRVVEHAMGRDRVQLRHPDRRPHRSRLLPLTPEGGAVVRWRRGPGETRQAWIVAVIAIGGSASVGKTTLAARISPVLGLEHVVHVDDVRYRVDGSLPRSFVETTPDVWKMPPAWLRDSLIAETGQLSGVIAPEIEALSTEHSSGLIEGEGVEPRLVRRWTPERVRAVYVIEDDADRLHETFSRRASGARFLALSRDEQKAVVEMNRMYGTWLRAEAEMHEQPWLAARPWSTLAERVLDAIASR